MNAIMVSVDYNDLLAVTLPYNRRHFDQIWVVTTPGSKDREIALNMGAHVYKTDSFYANGAVFNKWVALEEGLDAMGRGGWICLMDADVLWPKNVGIQDRYDSLNIYADDRLGVSGTDQRQMTLHRGQLCTPLRRILNPLPVPFAVPSEGEWGRYPLHHVVNEWSGYSQIFHANDSALRDPPWHDIDWTHAGGADSFFQARWLPVNKVRPPFECLHLGPAGVNWMRRTTDYLDGTIPDDREARRTKMASIARGRRGKRGDNRFDSEKLRVSE